MQNARRALRAADYGYVVDGGQIAHRDTGTALLGDDRVWVMTALSANEGLCQRGGVERVVESIDTMVQFDDHVAGV